LYPDSAGPGVIFSSLAARCDSTELVEVRSHLYCNKFNEAIYEQYTNKFEILKLLIFIRQLLKIDSALRFDL
jgi:NADPH-dependent 7-cyano-7-deazaguanine reductase QueF-like protein